MNVYEEIEHRFRNFRGEKLAVGRSAFGRNLYAFFVGKHTYPIGISQYAIHGREFITALLALGHIDRGLSRGGVWILPMVNPDGCLLSERGILTAPAFRRERLLSLNRSADFSLWKANGEGVDLNVNFPARWGTGERNVRLPASENYIGSAPCSAPETRALRAFTLAVRPDYTLSWHTKGEEIYWRFHQAPLSLWRDRRLARILSQETGYPLKEAKNSAGGYKDWCVERLKIPAFTVECGREDARHPLGRAELEEIIRQCGGALQALSEKF